MKGNRKLSTIALVMAISLTGCSASNKSDVITLSSKKEPLNIIDDNYRTYYEIYLGSYCDSNNDGIGDINGLISKLDYLNDNDESTDTDLGITGIWLMPIDQSPSYHKYDVTDYYTIDPAYGTNDDFKELMAECHKRGVNVIIDFIFNHTSNEHPWFQQATTYLASLSEDEEIEYSACPYAEYYNFSRENKGKSNWHQVAGTDWYYEGQFSSYMPDLNLSSDVVRKEIEEIASYWMDLGVDGFRLDAAKEYYTGNHSENVRTLKWFNDYVKNIDPDCYIVAEVWDSIGTIAQYYESGINSVFNYYFGGPEGKIANLVNQSGKGRAGKSLGKVMQSMQDTLTQSNPDYIDASFLSNHDNDRCINYVGSDLNKMKMMAGINLCMSGSSFLYYGEEIGLSGNGIDENKRGPMFWSKEDQTGMTTGPANMSPQSYDLGSVEDQAKEKDSLLNYYKNAIRLRNENPELLRGEVEIIDNIEDGDLCGIRKTYGDSSIYVFYNLSDQQKELNLDSMSISYEKIKGALLVNNEKPRISNNTLTLPSFSIIVLK